MEKLVNEFHLVQQMQSGDKQAFAALYQHYSPRLYINIKSIVRDPDVAGEIVQELFTRVWQHRDSKGLAENFAGYMVRIAQNLVHDFFRRLKKERALAEKFKGLASESYELIEETLQRKESSAILRKAMDQLAPQQRKVYQLVKLEGLSYKKCAEEMGISPITVKEYLVAANKSIKKYLLSNKDNSLALVILAIVSEII